ncbi:hypothetical protein HOC98_02225 [archaeon]|nr:hypothetical protein [archaeon]
MTDYDDAGVDVALGDEVSKMLYAASKLTWQNRAGRFGEIQVAKDSFSGARGFEVSNLPLGTRIGMALDGIGTKIEVAERIGDYTTIAHDLIAMAVEDAIVLGAEPFAVGSVLDVNRLKDEVGEPFAEHVKQLARGYVEAADLAQVAVIDGETAEIGMRVGGYGPFNANWAAAALWVADVNRLFTGREIQPGDYLVGLKEGGFRSNGLSLVRKIATDVHGDDWHNVNLEGVSLGERVLTPSKIYTRATLDMCGRFEEEGEIDVHGFVHVTGGGLVGKLQRVLGGPGLGATMDNLFDPARAMSYFQQEGDVSDKMAYQTWNMGQGFIVITPNPLGVMQVLERYEDIEGQVIGQVTDKSRISLVSNGLYSQGGWLNFPNKG